MWWWWCKTDRTQQKRTMYTNRQCHCIVSLPCDPQWIRPKDFFADAARPPRTQTTNHHHGQTTTTALGCWIGRSIESVQLQPCHNHLALWANLELELVSGVGLVQPQTASAQFLNHPVRKGCFLYAHYWLWNMLNILRKLTFFIPPTPDPTYPRRPYLEQSHPPHLCHRPHACHQR